MQETSVGHALDEDGTGGPYTIFVPSNEALNNMKDGTLDYLLSPEVWHPTYSDDIMKPIQTFSKLAMCNKWHMNHHLSS